jgi:pimeloyl-ACP methyl ester carboxylesterase
VNDTLEDLISQMGRPRRRALPRVAASLHDSDHFMVPTPNGAVATWRLGRGPAILFVHGWEDDNSLWEELIEAISQRGRAVIAMDLPGHGYSEGALCNLPLGAEAVRAVVDHFGDVDAIATHSFGGPVTQYAMLNGAAAQRIALIAAPTSQPRQLRRAAERYGIPMDIFDARFAPYLAADSIEGEVRRFDMVAEAPAMVAEALIVHSMDDEGCPVDDAIALSEAWPHARSVIVDGLGHRNIAKDPAIIAEIVDFLDPV